MSAIPLPNSRIEAVYRDRTPESAKLAAEAAEMFPSGVTHDGRHLEPYGIYVERASGPRKWDVDGNEYVDYYGGHGSLLLGHSRPEVVAAVQEAIAKGSHFGTEHPSEIHWTRLIKKLVPSAQRVRFTASGTEATHMAVRLARAHTGRSKLARFRTHFHGWHDHMIFGWTSHFDGSPSVGILPSVADKVVLLPPEDVTAARDALERDPDIAAVILEPTGGSFGRTPATPEFVAALREITTAHGVLLIFDEVVTGFRVSPGGAQARLGITPDVSTLAKILAGGLPGGAVVGRKEVLDHLDFGASARSGTEKIEHPGTFNANPVSAAAGTAALGIIATSDACDRANAVAAAIRERLNQVLAEEQVPWAAYGTYSGFHLFTNPESRPVNPLDFDPLSLPYLELKQNRPGLVHKLRLAMLVNGVDFTGSPGGLTSATHGETEVDLTAEAFRESLRMLRQEGVI